MEASRHHPTLKIGVPILKNEDCWRNFWKKIKHTNIHVLGIPEREEWEKEAENIFKEIMTENFPNLGRETGILVQEATRWIQSDPNQDIS